MSIKIDIEDLEMLLVATKIPQDKQKIILDEAKAMAERLKEQNEKKSRTKSEFLVMPIISDEEEREIFENHSYIVFQVPQDIDKDDVLDLMHHELITASHSPIAKKNNFTTVGTLISKVKAKNLVIGDNKIKIKTKVPAAGIAINNNLLS